MNSFKCLNLSYTMALLQSFAEVPLELTSFWEIAVSEFR